MRSTVTDRVQKTSAACVPPVAGLLLAQAMRHGHPGAAGRDKSTPRACPTHSPRHLLFLSPSPRAAPSHSSRPPLPTARRRRRARSPPRKRVAQPTCSLAVVFSTFSTPPSVRLRRGKGKIAASSHRRHGCSRRRCCSTRTTATVTLPSPPLPRARS